MVQTGIFLLRPLQKTDLQLVLEWRNSPRIRAVMFSDQIITPEEHEAWFERQHKQQNYSSLVFEMNHHPVGIVCFTDLDTKNKKCQWGFYLGVEGLPKGSGLCMGILGLRYGFEFLEMHKIIGEVLTFNTPSINFHKKLGFLEEGLFQKHIMKNGQYQDVLSLAMFRNLWFQKEADFNEMLGKIGEQNGGNHHS